MASIGSPGSAATEAPPALNRLNGLPRADALSALLLVCHSARWAARVADGRPYASVGALLQAADETWLALDPADWLEALHGHPRIGEAGGASAAASQREQQGVSDASGSVKAAIADGNRVYEQRFGHVFLVSAAGRSADAILDNLTGRLANDPATELGVAAQEHRRITRLRLAAALGPTATDCEQT